MGKYLDIARKFEAKSQEQESPAPVPQSNPGYKQEPKLRAFLPRPLGHEDAVDPFVAWDGLLNWLIAHHPDSFTAICEAEEAIRTLEAQGVTSGTGYEAACQDLFKRFEQARRLKLSQGVSVPLPIEEKVDFHFDSREEGEFLLPPWPCPHCGQPATVEDVFPSLDGERTLTLWRCDPCQTVGVTPDTIKQPPSWVKRVEQ